MVILNDLLSLGDMVELFDSVHREIVGPTSKRPWPMPAPPRPMLGLMLAGDYLEGEGRRHVTLPLSATPDETEWLQVGRLEERMRQDYRLGGTRKEQEDFFLRLHRYGYAAIEAAGNGGPMQRWGFVIYDNRHRSGDYVLPAITGLDLAEAHGALGGENGHLLRNFWFCYKIAMAIHEADPALTQTTRAEMAYAAFRRVHEKFSEMGQRGTGLMLFYAHALMALTGGPDHLNIIAGVLPEKFLARVHEESLRQLYDIMRHPHTAEAQEESSRRRLRHFFRRALPLQRIRDGADRALEDFARQRRHLERPEAMARSMGALLQFQMRLRRSQTRRDYFRVLGRVLTLRKLPRQGPYPANFLEKTNVQGSPMFTHTQLFLGALYFRALEHLMGPKEAEPFFPSRARENARFIWKEAHGTAEGFTV